MTDRNRPGSTERKMIRQTTGTDYRSYVEKHGKQAADRVSQQVRLQ